MKWSRELLCISLLLWTHVQARSQDTGDPHMKVSMDGLVHSVDKKSDKLQQAIALQTASYINKLEAQERRLQRRLARKNPAAADSVFPSSAASYKSLQNRLQQMAGRTTTFHNDYVGHLDSLQTMLSFLHENKLVQSADQLKSATTRLNEMQDRLNQAQEMNTWLSQRQDYLREQLSHYGLADKMTGWSKQAYYYKAQIEEYKRTFESMDRIEARALDLISKTDAFKTFFSQHSELGRLFQLPGAGSTPSSTASGNLQTIDQLTRQMQQCLGRTITPSDMTQQSIQSAAPQLDQLKEKAAQLAGGGGGDASMPNFKPNDQKTKTFLKRLEWGANVQSVKSNAFFPTTSDLALTLGYKLNSRSATGIGISYKMGWGRDLQHISLSSQGVGLRSYLDWKIKGSLWVSGGAEMNYLSQFAKIQQLRNYTAWQKSALLGLMKTYKASGKMTGRLQLLYDFLWRQQIPAGQPLLFRVGYNF